MAPSFARLTVLALLAPLACGHSGPSSATAWPSPVSTGTPRVGPPHGGSVIVVGGGGQGPEVFAKLIELAGGPDALILDVPTAGGDTVYPPDWRGQNGLRAAGAKNVVVLHTSNRAVANSDAFIEPIKRARGIWFEGGRHFHLIDSYGGTKTEAAFNDVLARGGVAAGSSAGASILGSFFVRGAPSNNNRIMFFPAYPRGFAYLRGVGIDQHVVARERLADIADSLMNKYRDTLFISEDEGTAWVVQGDIAEIIGRNKAFVYNGKDATDPGKPYLALHPGDKYNLATRHVIHRAIEESALTQKFIDDLFADYSKRGGKQATVLVAQNGKVFVNSAYGVPPQKLYMSETTVPNFPLGGLSDALNALVTLNVVRGGKISLDDALTPGGATVREYLARQKAVPNGSKSLVDLIVKRGAVSFAQQATSRIMTPAGMHKTVADSVTGLWMSNVDELYRWELGLNAASRPADVADQKLLFTPVSSGYGLGWQIDTYKGFARQGGYATIDGKRNAYVRFPDRKAAIIILTNDDALDARALAEKIAERLLSSK